MSLAILFAVAATLVLPLELSVPLVAFCLAARLIMEALARRAAARVAYVEVFLNDRALMSAPVAFWGSAQQHFPLLCKIVLVEQCTLIALFWNEDGQALGSAWYWCPPGLRLYLDGMLFAPAHKTLLFTGIAMTNKRGLYYSVPLACRSVRA